MMTNQESHNTKMGKVYGDLFNIFKTIDTIEDISSCLLSLAELVDQVSDYALYNRLMPFRQLTGYMFKHFSSMDANWDVILHDLKVSNKVREYFNFIRDEQKQNDR